MGINNIFNRAKINRSGARNNVEQNEISKLAKWKGMTYGMQDAG